jgi:hypothetical protein
MTQTNAARHSMDSPDWYSPSPLVEAARLVMGGIDLDPASSEEANATVQAEMFYDIEDNGLLLPWYGRVFHNPPGGLVDAFWKKFLSERNTVDQMVFVGYSLEQLQTLQTHNTTTPLDFPLCFPKKRIAFVENHAKRAERILKLIEKGEVAGASERAQKIAAACLLGKPPKDAPSHANYIMYVGPNVGEFEAVFSQFGQVRL